MFQSVNERIYPKTKNSCPQNLLVELGFRLSPAPYIRGDGQNMRSDETLVPQLSSMNEVRLGVLVPKFGIQRGGHDLSRAY